MRLKDEGGAEVGILGYGNRGDRGEWICDAQVAVPAEKRVARIRCCRNLGGGSLGKASRPVYATAGS